MARKLSRVARSVIWISVAAAAPFVAHACAAQSDVRVSSAAKQVVNPFAAKRQAESQRSGGTGDHRATGGKRRAEDDIKIRSPTLRVAAVRDAALAAWPAQPLASRRSTGRSTGRASVRSTPRRKTSRPLRTNWTSRDHSRSRNSAPRCLKFPKSKLRRPKRRRRPTRSQFGSNDLAQPAWLVPNETNSATTSEESAELSQQARAVAQPPADPFEEAEVADVVVSDDAPAAEAAQPVASSATVRTPPPPKAQSADEWFAQAERAAADAASTNELAAVVQLCQRGLECRPDAELGLGTPQPGRLGLQPIGRNRERPTPRRRSAQGVRAGDPVGSQLLARAAQSRGQPGATGRPRRGAGRFQSCAGA